MTPDIEIVRHYLNGHKRIVDGPDGSFTSETPPSVKPVLAALTRLEEQLEAAREAVQACYDDLQRYAPPHWRNQGRGEILARNFLTSFPISPTCTCPAGTYDYPNAVHEDYCASNPAWRPKEDR
jgi:hypothetical protein